MNRRDHLERVYREMNHLIRRSRELSHELHPGLSLLGYTLLTTIENEPSIRAADLAESYGMDKSAVSRQLGRLVAEGLLHRSGGRPGRRGDPLHLSAAGREALHADGRRVQERLDEWMGDWNNDDLAVFAELLRKLNSRLDE